MDEKHDPTICYLQETHFTPKDTSKLKVKVRWGRYAIQIVIKRAGVAFPTSEKIDFKSKVL